MVLDVADLGPGGAADGLCRLRPGPATVVLRHLGAAADPERAELLRVAFDLPRAQVWVAATLRSSGDGTDADAELDALGGHFDQVVVVPPLRHRSGDVRDLVSSFLGRLAGAGRVRVEPAALQALLRHPWPGNATELEAALAAALRRHPAGPIRFEDLPASVHCSARRVLSELESVERDMIVRALIDAGGDKNLAAKRVGISRATIYRKIRTYGIVVDEADSSSVSGQIDAAGQVESEAPTDDHREDHDHQAQGPKQGHDGRP